MFISKFNLSKCIVKNRLHISFKNLAEFSSAKQAMSEKRGGKWVPNGLFSH